MKSGKKKFLIVCLAAGLALSCLLPAANVSAAEKINAITDKFDNAGLVGTYDSEIWSEYAAEPAFRVEELAAPGKVLEFKGKNANSESTVLMSKNWFWEVHSLTFEMKIPEKGSWAGVDFADIEDPLDYLGDFKEHGEPMCYGALKVNATDDFGIPNTDWTYWGFADNDLSDTWIRVRIVSDGEKSGRIYIAPKGQAFDTSKAKNITLSAGQSFRNCNIVFMDYMFTGYMLDNIVIDTDAGVYTADFEDGQNDLFELVTLSEGAQNFSVQIVEDGAVRKMSISDAAEGDRLIANEELLMQDEYLQDGATVMDASFTVDCNDTDEEIAYVFGLAEKDAEPFAGTWAYVMNRSGARLVRCEADGTETVCASGSFTNGGTVRLTLTKEGSFAAYLDGNRVLHCDGVSEYGGYAGFAAMTAVSAPIYLDDVQISNPYYHVITTKSFSDDFSENRLGTNGNSDYACHAESGAITVSDGELVFDGCLDDTYFGPAYEYETYELSFRLTSILGTDQENEKQNATYLDRWLGIDFGKQSAATKTYGTYGMFLIRITAPEGEADWQTAETALYRKEGTSPLTGEELRSVKPIPASYFTQITYDEKTRQKEDISPEDAVCFKIVAENDRMELYLKRADEAEYTLYLTAENVQTAGYVALACTGWTFWTIDDFEIVNTASVYHEAPEVVIEKVEKVSYEERGLGVPDTGWEEEQLLNADKGGEGISPAVRIAGAGALVVIAAAVVTVCCVRRKKRKAS